MAALLKTSVKVLIGSAAVYVTFSEGVWSNSSEGSEVARRVRNQLLPGTSQYWEQVPSKNDFQQCAINKWNSGVQKSFNAVSGAPETVSHWSRLAVEKIKKQLNL